jgi:polar amino acid transport system permease protein
MTGLSALATDALALLADALVGGAPGAAGPLAVDAVHPLQGGQWRVVLDNWDYLAAGAAITVLLTLVSLLLGLLVGFPAGAVEVYGAGRLRRLVEGGGVLLRGTPIVVIMVVFFFGLPIPRLGEVPVLEFQGKAFLAAALALGLRSGAYQAQVFRGAIQSVGEGQMEAARSVGLSRVAAVRHVILPQALRRSVPGFQNEFTIVLKDTSVAFAVGLAELLTRGSDLFARAGGTAITEIVLAISLVYFVLTFTTNRLLDRLATVYAIPDGER